MKNPYDKLDYETASKNVQVFKNCLLEVEAITTNKLTPAMDSLGEKMTDVFAKAARDGKISADEISNAFLDMAKKILQEQVFSKLGPLGNILGSFVGGLAGGGNIQPNKPTLVGERGPELFVPNTGGRIANNHDTGNMLGGNPVTINQTINIEPTTQKDLVAMIHAARPMMQEDAKRAVMDAMSGVRY
jgi:phage-related minor tail protein